MALASECDDTLPSSLSDLPQRLEWTNRSARAEFFGKLAPRDVLRSIRGIDFALRNGPIAIIVLAPERTAGMTAQWVRFISHWATSSSKVRDSRSSAERNGMTV